MTGSEVQSYSAAPFLLSLKGKKSSDTVVPFLKSRSWLSPFVLNFHRFVLCCRASCLKNVYLTSYDRLKEYIPENTTDASCGAFLSASVFSWGWRMSVADFFTRLLTGYIGNNMDNDPQDVRNTKQHLKNAGYLPDDREELESPFITRKMDEGIKAFQQ